MTSIFTKNLSLLFSKITCLPSPVPPPSSPPPSTTTTATTTTNTTMTSSSPDFSSAIASPRFFFSSPGPSNSILHSSPEDPNLVPSLSVPVRKCSPDPYADFRRSMQEMIEAREGIVIMEDWEYLKELLLCYLALNHAHTHQFILSAFCDLLVSLVSSSTADVEGWCLGTC